jgi:homeobox-leucine zipper protein
MKLICEGHISYHSLQEYITNCLSSIQMTAEFQLPTPLVPTRESYFVRYCKQHADGTWAVVDVSLDNLRPSPGARCRRRPSGCLIQEMLNGYSKVNTSLLLEVVILYFS